MSEAASMVQGPLMLGSVLLNYLSDLKNDYFVFCSTIISTRCPVRQVHGGI